MPRNERDYYNRLHIKQIKGTLEVFDRFFEMYQFRNIIEIGTGNGGFSTYIVDKIKDKETSFITCDIRTIKKRIKKHLLDNGATVITGDVNENDLLEEIVKSEGRCLILNDGALKLPQFVRFSKVMKPKDIMLTHDYYRDRKSASGIITAKNVRKCRKRNNLKVIHEDMFEDFIWLCVIKEG